jgi:hypothetical protein
MSKRVQIIRHKGVAIVHINWAGARPAETLEAMEDAKRIIAAHPPGSVRTLTNVTGAHVDRAVTDALKGYVAHNKPFVLAGAVVGLNDLKMIAFNFVNRVTGRTLRAIDTEEEAKDWLAAFGG